MAQNQPPAVGTRIRAIRKEHGFTLEELSLKCGVSKSMLSQIETESVNPTIATVWKIASGLGIEFRALLEGKEEPAGAFHISRRKDATILDVAESKVHLVVLSPLEMVNDLEMYLLQMDQGAVLASEAHHQGTEEYLTVLEGQMEVELKDQTVELSSEDAAIYDADVPHVLRAVGDAPVRAHLTVRFSKSGALR
ncbi:MAG: helix-turn-helix domain-containing protein [Spirochaetales bacterium]|nr:helix-turn-helix domain-containing protein [Spirochaetales bacterium]